MSFALSAAVTGLQAHQTMLDVAGNNLANVNTTGYKSSSVTFSDLLSQTIKTASGPTGQLGGTNPQQLGSGVGVSNITRDMSQGNILSTGQDLDCAIDGSGYFCLSNGEQEVYTRIGAFSVDSDNTLVDPATGYKVQRLAQTSDEFQTDNTSIHIPYDAAMPANATSEVVMNGNLRATAETTDATTHKLTGDVALTNSSSPAAETDNMCDIDQWTGGIGDVGTIRISGIQEDGTAFGPTDVTWTGAAAPAGPTVRDVLDDIEALFTDTSASLDQDGNIVLTGNSAGYSQAAITSIAYVPSGAETFTLPDNFDLTTAGGNDTKTFNINVYDSLGNPHVLSGVFVKGDYEGTSLPNRWDMIITSVEGASERDVNTSGTTYNPDWRIRGISFATDGSYNGLVSSSEPTSISVVFSDQPSVTQSISFDLGTVGEFTGLTQFYSEQSSANALRQDGYEPGELSSVSIDQGGNVIGTFTNGVKQTISALKIAVFQNPQGLEAVGNGYFLPSANSGLAVETTASNGGAGVIKGQHLEKSNVDVATEFVSMMEAQNGYQANSRTIRVANDVLRELTNIIR